MAHVRISAATAATLLLSLSICYGTIEASPIVTQPASPLHPLNTAMVAGRAASLSCASNGSLVTWTRQQLPDAKGSWQMLTTLASDCALNPLHELTYSVEQDGRECDLVVKNASVQHAAMYICSQCGGFEPAHSAQLAVLGGLLL